MLAYARAALVSLTAVVLVLPPPLGGFTGPTPASTAVVVHCGVERWSVKTGTDADAGLIDLSRSTATSVASLAAIPAPRPLPMNNRIRPTETTVFAVTATLTLYKLEDDSDYHLVIDDGLGNTFITEIPHPACVGAGSPLAPGIQTARSQFDARLHATPVFQTANLPVRVRGVGFFDLFHNQTGRAPNLIELHPVLEVIFNPAPAVAEIPEAPTSAAHLSTLTTTGAQATSIVVTDFGATATR